MRNKKADLFTCPTKTLTPENLLNRQTTGPLTNAKLLDRVSGKPISGALRVDILAFYADPEAPFATKKNMNAWHNVLRKLDKLKASPVAAVSD